jgi:hypothetical protein
MALQKVLIIVEPGGETITAMFNPEEYSLSKDNNFAVVPVPGLGSPLLQFVNGNSQTLAMELFFDTYEEHTDVREETDKIANLLVLDSDLHAPPVLKVSWATLQFRCVLARLVQKFILFFDDGRPARARLTVTFNEFVDPERAAKQANLQTADFSKVHIVVQGETLSGIAGKLYNDPRQWRPIAIANGIDDPRALTPGSMLQVPSLPFVDSDSGQVFT